jgi:hypothetical protein
MYEKKIIYKNLYTQIFYSLTQVLITKLPTMFTYIETKLLLLSTQGAIFF